MGDWTPAAAHAAKNPPRILASFTVEARQPQVGTRAQLFVEFKIACGNCTGTWFRIHSFPKVAPDPSPYHEIAPGETLPRPPHDLECAGCGTRGRLFDARTDGYDGVLNGGCAYESGEAGDAEEIAQGRYRVTVTLIYNVELPELLALAQAAGVGASDLFDAICIEGVPVTGAPALRLDYECA